MNKLLALCGLVLLGSTSTPEQKIVTSECDSQEVARITQTLEESNTNLNVPIGDKVTLAAPKLVLASTPEESKLNDIAYLEEHDEIVLDFDTADYLPENFDPHKVYVDFSDIPFLDEEQSLDLNFDTVSYLPEDFNAYANPGDINAISYIEDEPSLDFGFNTEDYLPEGFDPYKVYFDLDSIEYIEEEDEVELDFDTTEYLPKGFDPYSR